MARTTDDMPTISGALEELSDKEVEKIDRIFNDPDFFESLTGLLMICGGFDGADEDYLQEVYNEICEVTEQDATEYADSIDMENIDLEDIITKMAKLPTVMKATVATIIGRLCEEAEDDEEGTLQYIIDQFSAMID
ncbi:MAG: hypothetical protein MJZ66_02975 [Bacteroidales bacterium]|nr:hypothetical protein [Bacteroidales bacterium]